jgi:hypothetical protein
MMKAGAQAFRSRLTLGFTRESYKYFHMLAFEKCENGFYSRASPARLRFLTTSSNKRVAFAAVRNCVPPLFVPEFVSTLCGRPCESRGILANFVTDERDAAVWLDWCCNVGFSLVY